MSDITGRDLFRLLAAIACLLMLSAGCRDHKREVVSVPDSSKPALQLQTVVVETASAPEFVEVTGTVTGQSSVPIATKLMAEIKKLDLEVGQSVTKGQVLAVLDDAEIRAMRSEAAAFRAEAQAALSEVAAVQRQAEAGVAQARAALEQSRTALADAQRDFARSQVLFEENVIARAQLDKAQLGVDLAQRNVDQAAAAVAQAEGSVAQAGSRSPQVEAKMQQAGARDLQAAALQEYAVLRAPFDGKVTAKYFEQGQLSVPGQPIIMLELAAGERVSAQVPEVLAGQLQVGDTVQLALDTGDSSRELGGTVAVIGSSADPASRTLPVEVQVPAGSGLRSGQFIRLRLPRADETTRLLVPSSSVVPFEERDYVWRVGAGAKVARVPVDIGEAIDGNTEILRGLASGDAIVLDPPLDLYDGALVTSPSSKQ